MTPPPSGEQIELRHDGQSAVVVEVGGGLRTYSAGGRELLFGYGEGDMSRGGRGQVLLPWPNRLKDGSYEFEGRRHQLPLDDPEEHAAIHGLVRWVAWRVAERDPDRVVMEHVIHPRPGYPFTLAVSIEYGLSGHGLRVRTTATNAGTEPCPYGCGAHPYLTVGTPTIDTVILHAPGSTLVCSDDLGIPTGTEPVEGTDHDFRSPRPIGATRLDNALTDLERDEDGVARVSMGDAIGASKLTLWVDESYGYLMLFTGDALPNVDRRALAVEPMTCPPNAFQTGQDVIRLEPGQSFSSTWGISPY